MEDEIISKLRLTLGKPITEECQVVYIMVEMRKLLDRTQKIKKGSDLLNCFGILKKDKEWEEIDKDLKIGWKTWSKRYA